MFCRLRHTVVLSTPKLRAILQYVIPAKLQQGFIRDRMKNVAGFLPHFRKTQKIFTTSNQKSDPHKNRLTTCIKIKHTSNRQITKIGTLLSLCRQSNKSRHEPAANATSNRIRKSARRHAAADP